MTLPATVIDALPVWDRVLLPMLNLLGQRAEYRITVTSPDYAKLELLWGLVSYEQGEKREFCIRGTPAYIDAVRRRLEDQWQRRHHGSHA